MTASIRSNQSGPALIVLTPEDLPPPGGSNFAFLPAETDNSDGTRRVKNLGDTGQFEFNVVVPSWYTSESVVLVGYADESGAVGSGKSITMISEYGAFPGGPVAEHGTELTADVTIPTAFTFFGLNLLAVLGNLSAGDIGGVDVSHNSIGGNVSYMGVLIFNAG